MNILIIEDHPVVSESLQRIITDEFPDTFTKLAQTAKAGLACLNHDRYEVILLDVRLPDGSGLEVCKQIKQNYPDIKVIIITSFAQRYVIETAFSAGANGFLLKSSETQDIANAIKMVFQNQKYYGSGVPELLCGKYHTDISVPTLTKREMEVLKLIAEGLNTREIAQTLFISEYTAEGHRKNLLIKFNVKNTALLIKKAVEEGLTNI